MAMGVRYEWADDSQIVMNIYVEFPWTWDEYHQMFNTVMPMIRTLQHPCADIIDMSKYGSMPRGNIIQNLLNAEKALPDNLFGSVVVGAPYPAMVFINMLMKMRPRIKRM